MGQNKLSHTAVFHTATWTTAMEMLTMQWARVRKSLIWGVLLLVCWYLFKNQMNLLLWKSESQVQRGGITLSLAIKEAAASPQLFVPQLLTRPFVHQLFPPIPPFFLSQANFFTHIPTISTSISIFYLQSNFFTHIPMLLWSQFSFAINFSPFWVVHSFLCTTDVTNAYTQ